MKIKPTESQSSGKALVLPVLGPQETAQRLPFIDLCSVLAKVAAEYAQNLISCPERQVLPLSQNGVLFSMPAVAQDIAIHKLITVCSDNAKRGLPAAHGLVSVYDSHTGQPVLMLDGPTVTARRTAAVSMLAIQFLHHQAPKHVVVIGAGVQSAAHVAALAELWPGLRVDVQGRNASALDAFCQKASSLNLNLHRGQGAVADEADVVITLTASNTPVYNMPSRHGRLLVGVGSYRPDMAELGPQAIAGSQLFTDDLAGARHEAGDFIQAGVDWAQISSLADALVGKVDTGRPSLFKSVGCAAWDLAAARCAVHSHATYPQVHARK